MDLTPENVLTRTTINWDDPVLYPGITPIKYNHIKEIEEAVTVITGGLATHAASCGIDVAHGRVSSTNSGFMTKELVGKINALKAGFQEIIDKAPYISPFNFITAYDKSPSEVEYDKGYRWCNGHETVGINTQNREILGAYSASPLDEYPDGSVHVVPGIEEGKTFKTFHTITATYQKRIQQ